MRRETPFRRQSTFENQLENVLGRSKNEEWRIGANPDCKISNIFKRLETNITKKTSETMFDQFTKLLYKKIKQENDKLSEIKNSRRNLET